MNFGVYHCGMFPKSRTKKKQDVMPSAASAVLKHLVTRYGDRNVTIQPDKKRTTIDYIKRAKVLVLNAY